MTHQCELCHGAGEQTQLVVYKKEQNARTGYLAMGNRVFFNMHDIAKFLYYCATRGVQSQPRAVLAICDPCINAARVGVN